MPSSWKSQSDNGSHTIIDDRRLGVMVMAHSDTEEVEEVGELVDVDEQTIKSK